MKKQSILFCSLFFMGITLCKAQYTDLVDFTGSNGSYPGANPTGDLILSGNMLFGMTSEGGANGLGNIFSFTDKSLGINQWSVVSNQWSVYPNPSNGQWTINNGQ